MLSEKGRPINIVDVYKFYHDRELNDGIEWKCSQKGCKSYINTNKTEETFIMHNDDHGDHKTTKFAKANLVKSQKGLGIWIFAES